VHEEVTRIGIDIFTLLAPCGFGGDQFEIERSGEADGYRGLRIWSRQSPSSLQARLFVHP
jgi:hypothetical protein